VPDILELLKKDFGGYSWETVKASGKRSVYRLSGKGRQALYVKVYHPESPFQRIRNFLFPRTGKEADTLNKLSSAGIKAAEVTGQYRSGSSSAIVLKAVEPGRQLDSFDSGFQEETVFRIARGLLKKGFIHDDIHSGNIIIDDNNEPVLVDCYEIRQKKRLGFCDEVRVLASAAAIFGTPLSEIKKLLPGYSKPAILMISVLARHFRMRRVRRLSGRSLANGSFSEIIRTEKYSAASRRGLVLDLDGIIASHRKNIEAGTGLLKIQEKTQLSAVGRYCVKSYKKAGWPFSPYAVRAWKGALILKFNGFRVAEPAACAVFKDSTSILVSEKLELPQLDRLLAECGLPDDTLSGLAAILGNTIGRMHALGVFHADLKACNIFVDEKACAFVFIDTDRVGQPVHIPKRRRLKNLVQIGLSIPRATSAAVRKRFIEAYAIQTGDDAESLFNELAAIMKGREIVYTTSSGDRFETF
jgi:tRNA A-37 threonylcarbamoyl transferase component Bud32